MTVKQKVLKEVNTLPDYLLEEAYLLISMLRIKKKGAQKLPITPAKKGADFKALAGIWEGRGLTLEQLRQMAWGKRC